MRTVAIRLEGTLHAVRIPARFNGPRDSANGGYTCGLVAAELHGGGAEVTLRAPPPLETELAVERANGDSVRVSDGETLVAEARSAAVDVGELPAAGHPGGGRGGGRRRPSALDLGAPVPDVLRMRPEPGHYEDGLDIFPVEHEGGRFVATWTPGEAGMVWAALDCPTSAPVMNEDKDPPIVLARLAAADPRRAEAWVSRTCSCRGSSAATGASASPPAPLFDRGRPSLAHSHALWIELRA